MGNFMTDDPELTAEERASFEAQIDDEEQTLPSAGLPKPSHDPHQYAEPIGPEQHTGKKMVQHDQYSSPIGPEQRQVNPKQYKKSIGPEPRQVNPNQYVSPIGPELRNVSQQYGSPIGPEEGKVRKHLTPAARSAYDTAAGFFSSDEEIRKKSKRKVGTAAVHTVKGVNQYVEGFGSSSGIAVVSAPPAYLQGYNPLVRPSAGKQTQTIRKKAGVSEEVPKQVYNPKIPDWVTKGGYPWETRKLKKGKMPKRLNKKSKTVGGFPYSGF